MHNTHQSQTNNKSTQLQRDAAIQIFAGLTKVKSGICCKFSLNRLMTYGLRTARHREDIAERVG